jgi:vancomycin resistance protein YoaR
MADDFYQKYGPIERRRKSGEQPAAFVETVGERPIYQPEPTYTRPTRRPRRRLRTFLWGSGITLLLIALLAGAGLWYLNRTFAGRIYPNVAIQGIDVSQLTPEEARTAIHNQYDGLLNNPLTMTFNGRSWEPSAETIGLTLNIDATIDEAYGLGRGGNLINSLRAISGIWRDGYDIPIALTIDEHVLKAYLVDVTRDLTLAPKDANLIIGGTNAAITPSREGRIVLVDQTALDITNNLHSLAPASVVLRTEVVKPTLNDNGVADAKRTVDAILQSALTLTAGSDRSWELSVNDLRALIKLERQPDANGNATLVASLDEGMIRQRVATYADEIGRGSVNPRVDFNGGDLLIMREGVTGLRLDEEASASRITQQATVGVSRTIELVVNQVQPDVTPENLHELGLVEAVGVGKSSFVGSAAYRITNIEAGSRLLDGILIAPGEEFSFNENVGTIDDSNGFVKGYAIINNRTQEEWGGGICQDSTTLFRAAFHAGVPITERHEHSFRISWYEVYEPYGMDAAIFTGYLDFRFINDTGNWLLLNTYVDRSTTTVTYVLYGTKPNREVLFDGPYVTEEYPKPTEPEYIADAKEPVGTFHQTDTARGGMDITVYRNILQDGRVILREPFYTHFKPWADKFTYNPQTPLPPKGCYPNKPCASLPPAPPVQEAPPPAPTEVPAPPAPTEVPPPPAPTEVPPSGDTLAPVPTPLP